MGFFIAALYTVATAVLSFVAHRAKKTSVSPASEVVGPTAKEGGAIPVIFGTCKIAAPNIIWWGDSGSEPFGDTAVNIQYKYFMGFAAGICMGPVDNIRDISWEDKRYSPARTNTAHGCTLDFQMLQAFGVDDSVIGRMEVYFGDTTQTADPYLANPLVTPAPWGADMPPLRRLCYAVWKRLGTGAIGDRYRGGGGLIGNSPYLHNFSAVGERCPNSLGLASNKHKVNPDAWGVDANPACILWEMYGDTTWGQEEDAAELDSTSFTLAGNTLYTEGLGMSFQMESIKQADEWWTEVLQHIDAVSYVDPTINKRVLKLIRNDYDPTTLPILDISHVGSCEMQQPGWESTANVVRLTYVDRTNNSFVQRSNDFPNAANIAIRNGIIETRDMNFSGLSGSATAAIVAGRVGKVVATPLPIFRLSDVDRTAYQLFPGTPFKLRWPPYGVTEAICRVTHAREGTLAKGGIEIEAVQDIFSLDYTPDVLPPPVWVPPNPGGSSTGLFVHAEEAPYEVSGTTSCRLMVLAARSDVDSPDHFTAFDIYSQPSGGALTHNTTNSTSWTPTAVLAGDVAIGEITSLTFKNLDESALFNTWIAGVDLNPDKTQHEVTAGAAGTSLTVASLIRSSGYYAPTGLAINAAGDVRRVLGYTGTTVTIDRAFPAGTVVAGDATLKYIQIQRDPIATGNTVVLVGDELMAFSTYSPPTTGDVHAPGALYGLARGVWDTAPKAWPAGTRVWFIKAATNIITVSIDDLVPAGNYAGHLNFSRTPLDFAVLCCPKNATRTYLPSEATNCYVARTVPGWIDVAQRGNSRTPRAGRTPCPCDFKVNGVSYPAFFSGNAVVSCAPRSRDGTGEPIQVGFRSGAQDHLVTGTAEYVDLTVWPEIMVDQAEALLGPTGGLYDYTPLVDLRLVNADLIGGRATYTYPLYPDDANANTSYTLKDSTVIYGTGKPSSVVRFDFNAYDYRADVDSNNRLSWASLTYRARRTGIIAPPPLLGQCTAKGAINLPSSSSTSYTLHKPSLALTKGNILAVTVGVEAGTHLDGASLEATIQTFAWGAYPLTKLGKIYNGNSGTARYLEVWMLNIPETGTYDLDAYFGTSFQFLGGISASMSISEISGVVQAAPTSLVVGYGRGSGTEYQAVASNTTLYNSLLYAGFVTPVSGQVLADFNGNAFVYDQRGVSTRDGTGATEVVQYQAHGSLLVPAGQTGIVQVDSINNETQAFGAIVVAFVDANQPLGVIN